MATPLYRVSTIKCRCLLRRAVTAARIHSAVYVLRGLRPAGPGVQWRGLRGSPAGANWANAANAANAPGGGTWHNRPLSRAHRASRSRQGQGEGRGGGGRAGAVRRDHVPAAEPSAKPGSRASAKRPPFPNWAVPAPIPCQWQWAPLDTDDGHVLFVAPSLPGENVAGRAGRDRGRAPWPGTVDGPRGRLLLGFGSAPERVRPRGTLELEMGFSFVHTHRG